MTENLGLGNRDYGFFSCEPTIKLLLDGRNVQIMEGATYTDPDGKVWTIYAGDLSDGATIPHELWSVVGGPFEGPYRIAALFHDRGCNYYQSIAERRLIDKMFRIANAAGGQDRMGEDPWLDIAGYGLLAAVRMEDAKNKSTVAK